MAQLSPPGPMSDGEFREFLAQFDTEMGGAYTNKAHPMEMGTCKVCGVNTLFSRAAAGRFVSLSSLNGNVETCGLLRCMEQLARQRNITL